MQIQDGNKFAVGVMKVVANSWGKLPAIPHNRKIEELFSQICELTQPKCATACNAPQSCCSPEYCEMAIERAKELGTKLVITEHPRLPLMGANGCIAAPHFRPLCTLHICEIVLMRDKTLAERYFDLRSRLNKEVAIAERVE